jgi:hypothetical protein
MIAIAPKVPLIVYIDSPKVLRESALSGSFLPSHAAFTTPAALVGWYFAMSKMPSGLDIRSHFPSAVQYADYPRISALLSRPIPQNAG